MLTLLVGLAKMASTLADNQFTGVVQKTIVGKEATTAFFGGFFAGLNAVSFFAQLLLKKRYSQNSWSIG